MNSTKFHPPTSLPPNSKRSMQKRSQVTRAILAKSAMHCFAKHGYSNASVKMIAEHADLSYQLIPYHFGSKKELWEFVITDLFNQAKKNVLKHFEAIISSPQAKKKAAFRKYLTNLYRPNKSDFVWIIAHELMNESEQYHTFLKPMLQAFVKDYVIALERLVDLKIIKKFTGTELAMILPTFANANFFMRDDYETMTGKKIHSNKFIELEVNLVMKILFSD